MGFGGLSTPGLRSRSPVVAQRRLYETAIVQGTDNRARTTAEVASVSECSGRDAVDQADDRVLRVRPAAMRQMIDASDTESVLVQERLPAESVVLVDCRQARRPGVE